MSFEPITTQEDLDKIIANRLAREREKFADYEDIKVAAAAGAEAIAERDELKTELLSARREHIAATTGVPVDLIVGDTVDAMQAHADGIRAVIDAAAATQASVETSAQTAAPAPAGPFVEGIGDSGTPPHNPLAELFG